MTGHTPSEISAILRGMDEVLIEESKRREATAPRCHMRRMKFNCGDNDDWLPRYNKLQLVLQLKLLAMKLVV